MRCLFMDIDGVINSGRTYEAFGKYPHTIKKKDLKLFDWVAIALIRKLCVVHKLKVVLTSTWRHDTCYKKIAKAFSLPIIDKTPSKLQADRGYEIHLWLKSHPEVSFYVILDDVPEMLEYQKKFFVHVDGREGFSYKDYLDVSNLCTMYNNKGM